MTRPPNRVTPVAQSPISQ